MPFRHHLLVTVLMLLVAQADAQQPSAPAQQLTPQPANASAQPALLNPQLMTDIHVPLLAVIDVLQKKQDIADALGQWEAASQTALPMAPEDEHIAYMLQKSKRTGHEISVAIDLQGRVRADELNKRFDWKTVEQVDNRIILTAEPRETVEQLFYRGFELQLDAKSHLPVSIRFVDRSGKQMNEPMPLSVKLKLAEPTKVTLASAETPIEKRIIDASRQLIRAKKARGSKPVPSDVPADVAALLSDWEAASAKAKKLQSDFIRRTYDSVFKNEKLSTGRLYFEAPNKGRMDIVAPHVVGKVSARKDADGNTFTLEADRQETWIWTGKILMQINEEEKRVEGMQVDGEQKSFFAKPLFGLPLVIDIRADEIKRNYELKILKRDKIGIWIEAKPREGSAIAGEISAATAIIDAETHLTLFVKYVDPSGNIETVYSFANWEVNKVRADNPLDPNLDAYRVHVRPAAKRPAPAQ